MFSKILAFGLGALALVNAAPAVFSFQTPMLSCSVNMLDTAAVKSFDEFPGPGRYKISNTAFPDSQLVARQWAQPVTLSYPGEDPGPSGVWDILPPQDGSAGYVIFNVDLRAATSSFRDVIVAGGTTAAPFAIEPAGGKEYVVKLPNEDKVWSLGSTFEALHLEPQQGAAKQLWRFEPVNDD
ncbi:hypothetical protein K438DRAFT_1763224 [Mycena galopus ATCC 62051]|nr:hypothetical protein K438DRAFT_1763224 [Mycena galopus ATCC 62051]